MSKELASDYGLSRVSELTERPAPVLNYRPRDPQNYQPSIGVIGCGGITVQHLNAYRNANYKVVALCSRTSRKAEAQRQQFYPEASVYTDYRELLKRADIEVVDIAAHPAERESIIEDALQAGKHVLSQKPFVVDIEVGNRLVELAARQGIKLAVNQNGRFAPHFSYIYQAIKANLLGQLTSLNFSVHWDHSWIVGTDFERIDNLVLYDFAIHWFDLVHHFFGNRTPKRIYASTSRAANQEAKPPLLAGALIDFEDAQASLIFNANVRFGQADETFVAGTEGTIVSTGASLSEQSVTLYSVDGYSRPALHGTWFQEGFHGAMGELLCAIEERREPSNSAADNLRSLELCFAAVASAHEGTPKIPGTVRRLPTALQL